MSHVDVMSFHGDGERTRWVYTSNTKVSHENTKVSPTTTRTMSHAKVTVSNEDDNRNGTYS